MTSARSEVYSGMERRDTTTSGREARARYEAAQWASLLETVESLVAEARECLELVGPVSETQFKTNIELFSV